MSAETDIVASECVDELRLAVRTLIKQRMAWASLPEKEREALKEDMIRTDRLVLGSAVERVIATVALFARMESAKAKEAIK